MTPKLIISRDFRAIRFFRRRHHNNQPSRRTSIIAHMGDAEDRDSNKDSDNESHASSLLRALTDENEKALQSGIPLLDDDDKEDEAPDGTGPPAAVEVDLTEATPPITTPPSNSGCSRKKRAVATTARVTSSSKKKKIAAQCRKGARVKVTRSLLFHVLDDDEQREKLKGYGNSRNFFGRILSGSGKEGYKIRFDDLPAGHQDVMIKRRILITVLEDGEEEKEHDHINQLAEELAEIRQPSTRKEEPAKESTSRFCALEKETISTTKRFGLKWGRGDDEVIDWKILADDEHITEDPLSIPDSVEYVSPAGDVELSAATDLNALFFEEFFPSVVGHAKTIDEFHADPLSPYYTTVQNDRILFHDADADDQDWKVKQAYTLMIAAASEIENGVENLWKHGPSGGRHDYPDFGKYMAINRFKAFQAAAPYCWCDKKHWFVDKRDRSWEIFRPCLEKMNSRRAKMMTTMLLMLDESMSGWRPKTSKLGGLPNYTYEPRKPVPLGTMFRNGVECISGILVYQDVVQNPEQQSRKAYHGEKSSLPGSPVITAHTAEVLRQVDGAQVPEGGWVGGDAWFGSMMSVVETYKRKKVHSTFIIKNNQAFFPMRPLHAVLTARFGSRPAGHWVVFQTTIADVKVFALAYAWSQRGVSYFLSTCGKTTPHESKYMSHFEDDFGNVEHKAINRPAICHFIYEYLPLIDEHNKQRQNLLNLKRCWCTKDPWMRLLTTTLGMCVVDMHRWYRNRKCDEQLEDSRAQNIGSELLAIRKFSDRLCVGLEKKARFGRAPARKVRHSEAPDANTLQRITKDGSATREPTEKQMKKEKRAVGSAHRANCFICRKFLKKDDTVQYQHTTWECKTCQMPLCKISRIDTATGRTDTCLSIHQQSSDPIVGCSEMHCSSKPFPKELQVNVHPRRSNRASTH
jgi:hypothetical protein